MAYPVYQDNGGIAAAQDFSVDVPYPGTVNANDILVVALLDADNDTFTVPNGWYLIKEDGANANCSVAWMWKRASGSETGTETFTSQLDAGQLICGVMYRFSGCITSGTPYEDADQTAVLQEATYTRPAVTTADNERLGVCIVNVEDNMTVDPTTNWVERSELLTGTGSDAAFELQDKQIPSATTEGADTASIGGDDYHGVVVFALLPAAAAGDYMTCESNGVATVSAAIKGKGDVSMASNGVASAGSVLKGKGVLQGISNGAGTASLILKGKGGASGVINGVSALSAILKGTGSLSGQADGVATADMTLKGKGKLQCITNGVATCFAAIQEFGGSFIACVSNGAATVSAKLKGTGRMVCSTSGNSNTTAILKGTGRLGGMINGTSVLSAILQGVGYISAESNGTSSASCRFRSPEGEGKGLASLIGNYLGF